MKAFVYCSSTERTNVRAVQSAVGTITKMIAIVLIALLLLVKPVSEFCAPLITSKIDYLGLSASHSSFQVIVGLVQNLY